MKVVIFEGTAEEYRVFLEGQAGEQARLGETGGWGEAGKEPPPLEVEVKDSVVVKDKATVETVDLHGFMDRVLTRRALSDLQRRLLESLCAAGETGLSAGDLGKKLDIDASMLAGVLGAFGRRIHGTRGADSLAKSLGCEGGIELLFTIRHEGEGWVYRARPELIAVLQERGLTDRPDEVV